MLKYPESTPCPRISHDQSLQSEDVRPCDPIEELNFTTEIRAAWRQAGPRRRKTTRPPKFSKDDTQHHAANGCEGILKGGSIGSQIHGLQQSTNLEPQRDVSDRKFQKRRARSLLAEGLDAPIRSASSTGIRNYITGHQPSEVNIYKKPRRRTIYVPSDDTTVFTIHPGMQAKGRSLEDISLGTIDYIKNSASRSLGDSIYPAREKDNQRKPLAAAPKRAPLQPTLKPLQEHEEQENIAGNGPGKENIPPGLGASTDKVEASKAKRLSNSGPTPKYHSSNNINKPHASRLAKQGASTTSSSREWNPDPPKRSKHPRKPSDQISKRRNNLYYGSRTADSSQPALLPMVTKLSPNCAVPVLHAERSSSRKRYPLVPEDITRPGTSEDTWLDDQQVSLRQFINRLFDAADKKDPARYSTNENSRQPLLQLYQSSDCSSLHRRLQASLAYGALNSPKGSNTERARLQKDVGVRQRFLATWTDSYNLNILHPALEAVTGCEIEMSLPNSSKDQECAEAAKVRRRTIETFLESCLLHNEDKAECLGPDSCWRRTILRSLMMVLLMDKAKEMKLISGNLFNPSSTFKSSRSIVEEISRLMMPSIGDIYRSLSQLHYYVHHEQSPLSEYQYSIVNLATDLRDGVRLAHLTEILLYPPQSLMGEGNGTSTIIAGGKSTMTQIKENQTLVLSQNLKFPCITRAQRMYNVHVTLNALRQIEGVRQIADDLRPEDVVDGHRERTLALLWGLVGKWVRMVGPLLL